jgi:hypothetical protein
MLTMPSHTSHILQPLDVSCFKPFKTVFRKERDGAMAKKVYIKSNKITLMGWVDKALD